jgi:NAD(P) transhydrogenase
MASDRSAEKGSYDYDLVVIGSGPGGQRAAVAAAKLGRRAVVIDRRTMMGGVCVNTGTIPSKTLREAVLHLTGFAQREMYGSSYRVKRDITVSDLSTRTQHVIGREIEVVRSQLFRNHVEVMTGTARFLDPHHVVVHEPETDTEHHVSGDKVVIAVGTCPARPSHVPFDGSRIVDSDQVLSIERIPDTMVVVGAGVIGAEYASMFAALGTRVTLVEHRDRMLDFCDDEIVESLKFHLRDQSMTFRFGERVATVEARPRGTVTVLESGKKIPADVVMYSAGRQGMTAALDLERAGLTADDRGRIKVDSEFRTSVDNIYAVGDVIGFPALAATSMEQGRQAAHAALGHPLTGAGGLQPYGIYTIPEISYVGATEAELTSSSIPYEVGVARYRELARGQIVGDPYGMLKLLVSTDDRRLLGVHVFGTSATELVHIGQAVMGCGGTVDYLVDTVFNFPTLSEAYKVAALNAVNKITSVRRLLDRDEPHGVGTTRTGNQ